jgi:hypothetical protein
LALHTIWNPPAQNNTVIGGSGGGDDDDDGDDDDGPSSPEMASMTHSAGPAISRRLPSSVWSFSSSQNADLFASSGRNMYTFLASLSTLETKVHFKGMSVQPQGPIGRQDVDDREMNAVSKGDSHTTTT